jgi:hypothetical protein
MKILSVSNAGVIPLSGIRLLGLSNKRPDQIGQFGTGLKEAVALALRNGCKFWIFSGLDRIDFSIQDVDGHKEICFQLSTGTERFAKGIWHPMGLSPKFGKQDWNSSWQVMREVICNAQDEGELSIKLLDSVIAEEGKTQFCFEYDAFIEEGLNLAKKRLLFISEDEKILEENLYGKILIKSDDKTTVFKKGVYIRDLHEGFYDYEINVQLTESRSCDSVDAKVQITEIWDNASVEMIVKLFQHFKGEHDKFCTEAQLCSWKLTPSKNWKIAFERVFGSTAVLCSTANEFSLITLRGNLPVILPDCFIRCLIKSDVNNAGNMISAIQQKGLQYEQIEPEILGWICKFWRKLENADLTTGKVIPAFQGFKGDICSFYEANTCNYNVAQGKEYLVNMVAQHLSDLSTDETLKMLSKFCLLIKV